MNSKAAIYCGQQQAWNQDFAKEGALNPRLNFVVQKMSLLSDVLRKLVQISVSQQTGASRRSPQPLRNFCDFSENLAILTRFGSHFARFCKPFERTKLLESEFIFKK